MPVVYKAYVHLKAAFAASQQSYGSRRLVTAMADAGFHIGRSKVSSLMRRAALKPVWTRKFAHTTDSKHNLPIAANVLDRQFNPSAPNRAYVSDITYIRTGAGWLYLAIVMDLYAQGGRLGDGTEHASETGLRCTDHGYRVATAGAGPDRPFGSRQPVRQ